jgi:hypothetical protein
VPTRPSENGLKMVTIVLKDPNGPRVKTKRTPKSIRTATVPDFPLTLSPAKPGERGLEMVIEWPGEQEISQCFFREYQTWGRSSRLSN